MKKGKGRGKAEEIMKDLKTGGREVNLKKRKRGKCFFTKMRKRGKIKVGDSEK